MESLNQVNVREPLTQQFSLFDSHTGTIQRDKLHHKYAEKLVINPELTRALVSFQANKSTPFYRWFKYKEAFSHHFIRYILDQLHPTIERVTRVLDPFAGAGTTLTGVTQAGCKATGIELLPVGTAAMRARLLADSVDIDMFEIQLKRLTNDPLERSAASTYIFPHLRITNKAFPPSNEQALAAYQNFTDGIANSDVRFLFWFAGLSILEDVSYTRKDGQYLRWDTRSGRELRSSFDKGPIRDFKEAVLHKLAIMLDDLNKRNAGKFARNVEIIEGSCLDELPKLGKETFDFIITSPPYCNRYDYSRTYALELAYLGYTEDALRNLRQNLLSATVENRTKRQHLANAYRMRGHEARYLAAEQAFIAQEALHEVLGLLYEARENGELNNNSIPTMVENYFFEMNLVIHDLARILAPRGKVVIVNDNIQYHGHEVPADLILSDLATKAGLSVDVIWVLPRGKGNSSQQMGIHGRRELRKCVYVWTKPA